MNSDRVIPSPATAASLEEETDSVGMVESLRRELERSKRELDRCQKRLAEMDGLFAAHKQSEALLQGEKKLTEMIARGDSLETILEGSCRLVEEVFRDSLAIIMLLDPDGKRLRRGAAPSFPDFMAAVDGFEIDPAAGTCSAAAARKEQVITHNIATDPHWAAYRELASRHGLRAGWATPILSSSGQVLGTFALYWPEPRSPTPQHLQIINQMARLVTFAIERKQALEALRRSEDYLRLTIDTIPVLAWCNGADGSNEFLNKRWLDYTGLSLEQGQGWGWHAAIHPEDLPRLLELCRSTRASGESGESEGRLRRFDGVYRRFLFRVEPLRDEQGRIVKWFGTNTDIDDRKNAEALLAGENRILQMVATGKPLADILGELCRLVDSISADSMATLLLVDSANCLRIGAAPRIPKDFMSLIDGIKIGPKVGSCGTAAYLKEQVIVTDIETDPLWADYRELARRYGLRAGWSTPIFSSDRIVLGVFGIYWDKPHSPTPAHLHIIEQITHLASVAIERKRAAEALRASEKLARGQAEALTLALDALARETDPDRIVEHVLRTVTAQLDSHSSSVWLRDENSGLMVFEFALEGDKFKTKAESTIGKGSPSLPVQALSSWTEIFRTGKPTVLEDIREGPDFPWRAHVLAQGIVTILVVPMMIAGKVEGAIGVRFTQKRTFRTEELELAQALANQAMLAIQLARLSAQSRQSGIIEERNRMARDIHDTLAQGFTGVIMHMEAAQQAMLRKRMEVVSGHLRGAGEIARDGLREARRSVQALRPLALEQKKLAEALEELINKLSADVAVQAKFTLQGKARELPPEWEANILRIGQEALTNALRHARASELDVLLVFDDREIRLNMRDNGCGFDPAGKYEGFGLRGMAERAEDMGGELSIQSSTGAGTTISVVLPLPSFAEPARP